MKCKNCGHPKHEPGKCPHVHTWEQGPDEEEGKLQCQCGVVYPEIQGEYGMEG